MGNLQPKRLPHCISRENKTNQAINIFVSCHVTHHRAHKQMEPDTWRSFLFVAETDNAAGSQQDGK